MAASVGVLSSISRSVRVAVAEVSVTSVHVHVYVYMHNTCMCVHACTCVHYHKNEYYSHSYTYSHIFTHTHPHAQLVYCLVHFTGDDKVPPYINRLINPSIETEERSKDDETFSSFYQDFDEEDYLTLRLKDPETLFQDNSYMKHLRRHANKSVSPPPLPLPLPLLQFSII